MFSPTTLAPVVVATLMLLAVTGVACLGESNGGGTAAPTGTPATVVSPESAIGFWVRNRLNQGFVANCDDAKRPQDVGKQCARYLDTRNVAGTEYVAYGLGPVFQFPTRIFVLQRAADSWRVSALQELDPTTPVPGIPWPITVGAELIVVGTGDCLFVRERPGRSAPEVECLPDGTRVKVVAGPIAIDGFEWWQLELWQGWAASDYLRYPDDVPESAGG